MQSLERLRKMFRWPNPLPNVPPDESVIWWSSYTEGFLDAQFPKDAKLVLELGAWLGTGTKGLLKLRPSATVISVDTWEGSGTEHTEKSNTARVLPTLYDTFLVNTSAYQDRLIPIRSYTTDAIKLLHAMNVVPDSIYIDADHSFEGALDDLTLCHRYFPSAVITGDDWCWHSVANAVKTFSQRTGVEFGAGGNTWWLTK